MWRRYGFRKSLQRKLMLYFPKFCKLTQNFKQGSFFFMNKDLRIRARGYRSIKKDKKKKKIIIK